MFSTAEPSFQVFTNPSSDLKHEVFSRLGRSVSKKKKVGANEGSYLGMKSQVPLLKLIQTGILPGFSNCVGNSSHIAISSLAFTAFIPSRSRWAAVSFCLVFVSVVLSASSTWLKSIYPSRFGEGIMVFLLPVRILSLTLKHMLIQSLCLPFAVYRIQLM